jgi:Catalase
MTANSTIDTELGEVLQENEEQLAHDIAEQIAAKIRQGPLPARRDAHPKAHGCVRAMFQVETDLPPNLAQGVFVPGKSYMAWIRFSNGDEDTTKPDAKGDARGMAIKLLDVPGDKILPEERDAQTQDFIMINHPVFFIDDAARYLALVRTKDAIPRLLQETKESLSHLLHDKDASALRTALENDVLGLGTILKGGPTLSLTGVVNLLKMTSSEIASPFETIYWSMVPYRLGDPPHKQKIKFRAKFCPPKVAATKPIDPSPNFLRETMIKQLAAGAGPRQFDFEVQPGTADMSVENSTVEWKQEAAPFIKVATITIPEQEFATPARDKLGENLSFTPWHALPQHRPLGAVNRIRRVVYETISKLRHERNNETPRREPTARDPEMSSG